VKILILHPGALGDIILSLPAVLLLRHRFPEAKIILAGDMDKIIVSHPGYADKLISLSSLPLHRLFSSNPLPESDLAFWNSFDRIVSWTGHGNPEINQRLGELGSEIICGCWRPENGDIRHVSQLFANSLHPWLVFQIDLPEAKISLGDRNKESAGEWLALKGWKGESLVALHPGAGGLAKRWPLESFRGLALQICRINSSVLIMEGPAEYGLGRMLSAGLPPERVYVAESIPLPLLSGLLIHCRAFAGNDSGIAHLAAGLGIPTIVIFGPTMPQQWAPLGKNVSTFWCNDGCLACSGGRAVEHSCLQNISPEDLWGELRKSLQGTANPSTFPR